MSKKINLSAGLEDSFEFEGVIEGKTHRYTAKYPSSKDLQPIRKAYFEFEVITKKLEKLTKKIEKAEENEDDRLVKVLTKDAEKHAEELEAATAEVNKAYESLITPIDDSMPILEFIESLPKPAKENFDKMLQTEIF